RGTKASVTAPVLPAASTASAPSLPNRWPASRGHANSGIAEASSVPTVWDVGSGRNIKWRTAIPGLGHSSPIVWDDLLFVTWAVPSEGHTLHVRAGRAANDDASPSAEGHIPKEEFTQSWHVYALDRRTGRIVWDRLAYEGAAKTERHEKQSAADPTPATDGTHLVVWFGSQGLYCYDLTGTLLWKKDLGILASGMYQYPDWKWNTASSPLIYKNL